MNTKSPLALGLAAFLSLVIAVPPNLSADPQAAGQPAGHVERVLPAASIVRGSKTMSASAKTQVDWLDLVNTQASGRARVALDDGSVLNVGSDSSVKVEKVDSGAQQTSLELAYGKLRTQAQKIAKPDGKFEVKTAAGVAGVVGTDFYVGYANDVMNVVAYEGSVRVCNLAGVCVLVKAGQMTNVRHGDNSAPEPPIQAPLDLLVSLSKDTEVAPRAGVGLETAGGIGKGMGILIGVLAVVPIVVFAVVSTHKSNPPTPVNPCVLNPNSCG
ncbi:MAG TPA: FecR family protein [Candidatus Acidoferrum sp.]|nr:FecR family protein [Candidatus Acidoferrum sp.]